jgi:hypothetical protein
MCTVEFHESLKTADRWELHTEPPTGYVERPVTEAGEWANCCVCHSTLIRVIEKEAA